MKKLQLLLLSALFTLFCSFSILAQDSLRVYINAGYVTNFQKCDECTKADIGGSIRIGILTKKWVGFYVGYLRFNEYHKDYIDYDDAGVLYIGGADLRFLKTGNVECYAKVGLAYEKFISTYSNRTETETSVKPDFGLLVNINKFNIHLGWQPSEPHHINAGLGLTFNL